MLINRRSRALLVTALLAVLLPLKALAASVMPITGMPGHHQGGAAINAVHDDAEHAHAHAHPAHDSHDAPATPHCAAHGGSEPADDNTPLHDHVCPHLGMASIGVAITPWAPPASVPRAVTTPPHAPTSVVLDVPRPPPNR